ncbi:hypothetical protein B0H15DRAFT_1022478 [Mycena belliarum]|uniref:Uncharacterized protein n=1 Tax=Mycena belliarum TaxID=1033014 RepID=A0AAD6U651_9AGAR|nr:hypothetical protein B0H15DRAFT_1022478 [Mycena belliae]
MGDFQHMYGHQRFASNESEASGSRSSFHLPYRHESELDRLHQYSPTFDTSVDSNSLYFDNRSSSPPQVSYHQESRYQPSTSVAALQHKLELKVQEVKFLAGENELLRAQNASLLDSVSTLSRISSSSAATGAVSQPLETSRRDLDQHDHRKVRFWQRSSYAEVVKNSGVTSCSSTGRKYTVTSFLFAEDDDGKPPTEAEVASMKAVAADIYFDLGRQGLFPPDGWSHAGLRAKDQFRASIERRFPVLRLCAAGWKADWIATHTYSNFKSSHGHLFLGQVKEEHEDILFDGDDVLMDGVVEVRSSGKPKRKEKTKRDLVSEKPTSNKRAKTSHPNRDTPTNRSVSNDGHPHPPPKERIKLSNPLINKTLISDATEVMDRRKRVCPPPPHGPTTPEVSPTSPAPSAVAAAPSAVTTAPSTVAAAPSAVAAAPSAVAAAPSTVAATPSTVAAAPSTVAAAPSAVAAAPSAVATAPFAQPFAPDPAPAPAPNALDLLARAAMALDFAAMRLPTPSDLASIPLPTPQVLPPPVQVPMLVQVPKPSAAGFSAPASPRRKAGKTYKPGKPNNAKNLCGRAWAKQNPKGTAEEYGTYWKELGKTGQKSWKELEKEAANAVAAALAAATGIPKNG